MDQLETPDAPGHGTGEAPAKECPECYAVIAAGYARCPECAYAFPPPERRKHDPRAATAGVLSGQVTDTEYEVLDVRYSVHIKRDAAGLSGRRFGPILAHLMAKGLVEQCEITKPNGQRFTAFRRGTRTLGHSRTTGLSDWVVVRVPDWKDDFTNKL